MNARNDARAQFAKLGLSSKDLDRSDIRELEKSLADAMKTAQCLEMRIDRRRTRILDVARGRVVSIRCRSRYFEDREAVTFNPDGFVGFAGWADDLNIRPFLEGFSKWCDALELRRAVEPAPEEPSLP